MSFNSSSLKRVILIYVGALLLFCLSAFSQTEKAAEKPAEKTTKKIEKKTEAKENKMFAVFDTSMGKIKVELFPKDAPNTVENFVSLAEGTNKKANKKGHFYDGLIFHRVIPNFMIQGGDPLGVGTGDPGYKFDDEQNKYDFSKPGILAMANAGTRNGKGTNGSQFFITTSTPTYLNGKHTIFGKVVEGYDVVESISNVSRGSDDKPKTDVTIKTLKIVREK